MNTPAEDAKQTVVPGSCLCGVIRFEVKLPSKLCVHCHCSMCRRNHGAAFVTWFAVPKASFRVVSGESDLTRYQSSDHGNRSFCSRCGSSLFCENDHDPGAVDITLASMLGPIDLEPQAHVYFDTHVGWVRVFDDLPKLRTVA